MKILVTGGAGFIGSHIVDNYLATGHEVVIIDNLSSGRMENVDHRARFYNVDIRDTAVAEVFRKESPEIVNHHAAQMDVRRSVDDPSFDADVNILGTLNILENCRKSGVKRVIFASSGGAVYGEQRAFPADEKHPVEPLSPYGISKLACEKYLFFYNVTYGIERMILRYSNVYGPRQNPHGEAGVIAIFINRLLQGEQPFINGNGLQTRDFVYIGDVVEANSAALSSDVTGIFNIGTAVETNINTLFRQLVRLTSSDSSEIHYPEKAGEQKRSVVDYSLARDILEWSPATTLSLGLEHTVEHFSGNRKSAIKESLR